MDKLKILGVVGSLRRGSYNRLALMAAQELVPDGAVLELIELHGLPIFDQDQDALQPPPVLEFKRRILAADALLFATPEYNHSVSGALKNAIDWASRPSGGSVWRGKPAALMGASTGNLGTVRAQNHLRQILLALDMPVVRQPEVMIAHAAQRFDADGKLGDEPTRTLIRTLLEALVKLAENVPVVNGQR